MVALPLLLACLVQTVLRAEPPPPLAVEQALTDAIQQNPRMLAATREIAAAQSGVGAARALENPEIVFAPGLTSPSGSDEELVIRQPLEVNGTRRARADVARAELVRVEAQALVELRDLVRDTKVAYYELARARELRGLAEVGLRDAEEFDKGVGRQVEEGLRPGVDRLQTGVEVSRARQQLTRAESQVRVALAALNTLRGHVPAEAVGAVSLPTVEPTAVQSGALLQRALAARGEIVIQQAAREVHLGRARLSRAEGRPDLVPLLRAESVVRGVHGAGLGLGISLPLWDHGSRRNRVRQAELLAEAQEARTVAARNQVLQEVEQAIARLTAAEAIIREYEQGVLDQATRLRDALVKGFQLGAPGTSVLTVLEAQRTHRAVQIEYTEALVDYAKARAELEWATGAAVPETLVGASDGLDRADGLEGAR